jgi:hypothetical protein
MGFLQEVSPLTSGRLSHSSEPLNGLGSLTGTDSPPVSPSEEFDDVVKVYALIQDSYILFDFFFFNECYISLMIYIEHLNFLPFLSAT